MILEEALLAGVNAVSGAGLGATFYILTKTQPYLVDRSFDPKYNSVYVTRFITGLIGGVILATGIGPGIGAAIDGKAGSGAGAMLTPGVLAIIGGYSAEAVEQVLKRLVDVLLALVQGDSSSQAQAKAAADQAMKNAQVMQMLAELEAAQPATQALKDSLQKIRTALTNK